MSRRRQPAAAHPNLCHDCLAPITWAHPIGHDGDWRERRLPFDAPPDPDGDWTIDRLGTLSAEAAKYQHVPGGSQPTRYTLHLDTCSRKA